MEAVEKNWMVKEFYNDYLALKEEIGELTNRLSLQSRFPMSEEKKMEMQALLDDKIAQFRIVVRDMELRGVSLIDLLLLSVGVDVE